MKKMTKGAIVTGLGVALLIGGGGTLATWKDRSPADAGKIRSGHLDVRAETGVWYSTVKDASPTSTSGTITSKIADINAYRIVPGETLTYVQDIEISLKGDELDAVLSFDNLDTVKTNGDENTFSSASWDVVDYSVTKLMDDQTTASGETVIKKTSTWPLTARLDEKDSGRYRASTTLAFEADRQVDMNKTLDLSQVGYVVQQQTPTRSATNAG